MADMTIVEFLLARIAEDEADVREWLDAEAQIHMRLPREPSDTLITSLSERKARETEAKRLLVRFLDFPDAPPGEGCYVAERVLALIAHVYADHPDYDPAWVPDA